MHPDDDGPFAWEQRWEQSQTYGSLQVVWETAPPVDSLTQGNREEVNVTLAQLRDALDTELAGNSDPQFEEARYTALAERLRATLKMLEYRVKREREYRKVIEAERRKRGALPKPTKGDVRGL